MKEKKFISDVAAIAVPASLQTLLQISVLSLTDQVMIGQLGSVSIAAVGLANKFSSNHSLLIASIGSAAGIMVAQYIGSGERQKVSRSFSINMLAAFLLSFIFCACAFLFPSQIAGIYTPDAATQAEGAAYLHIMAWNYIPVAVIAILSTMFRCMNRSKLALYISILSTALNITLDYLLIFGVGVFPRLGSRGAALATVFSQWIACVIGIVLYIVINRKNGFRVSPDLNVGINGLKRYLSILFPLMISTFSWLIADNVYAIIYGNMGTQTYASVTLLVPIQLITVSLTTGVASSAGILIAKKIGDKKFDEAYMESKKLLLYGLILTVAIALFMLLIQFPYVQLFNVEEDVKTVAKHLITIFAITTPFRMLNMILGGNIIRSGGRTKYIMYIDMIGSWLIGVPLAFLSARLLNWPIEAVNLIVSLDEIVRLIITLVVFKRKTWMYPKN